ncbi:hypothetical protein LSAT2_003760 [Lamellibrachia satsuma]|nr:hypothetical protein LSAT2_003760 [Lamellibrachia satsuma]
MKEEAQQQLDVWRNAMESQGLRVSQQKTEYLAPLASELRITIYNQELPTVSKFNTWARSSTWKVVLRQAVKMSTPSMEQVERTHRSSVGQEGTTEAQTSAI